VTGVSGLGCCMCGDVADEGLTPMTVKVPRGTTSRLQTVVARHRARRRELTSDARWSVAGLTWREAEAVRVRRRAEVARLREGGWLLDTVDSFALYGVRHELTVRQWLREWPDADDGAGQMGRWPGARDGGYPEAVSFRLPVGVARQVAAGCWSVSGAAVAALRDWRDRHPGIVVSRAGRDRGALEALAEYGRLADQVITVGDVLRAGLEWALCQQGAES
jgi:hypothetical protein